jgi:hypothetical protein
VSFAAIVAVVCLVRRGDEEQTARQSAARTSLPRSCTTIHVIGAHDTGVNARDTADTRSFFAVEMLS